MAIVPEGVVPMEALHRGRLRLLLRRHGTAEGRPCLGSSQLRADAGTTGGMGRPKGSELWRSKSEFESPDL